MIKPTDNYRRGVVVRLIADDNEPLGLIPIEDAIDRAEAAGLDLVLVAEQADPPVCRIMDFKKRLYDQKRAQKEARKKQSHQKIKEMKFQVNIDDNDFNIKIKRVKEFLNKGHKIKCSLRLRGREMNFQEKAMKLMQHVAEVVSEISEIESKPKFTGRQIFMSIAPISSKSKKPRTEDNEK